MDPVAPMLEDLHPDAIVLGPASVQLRPSEAADLASLVPDRDRRGGHCRDPYVRARALRIVVVPPSATRVVQVGHEIVLREAEGVAGEATINLHEGLGKRSRLNSIGRRHPDRAGCLPRERVLARIRY